MDDDAFWNIQLEHGNRDKDDRQETWLAPMDRSEEALLLTNDNDNEQEEEEDSYQWQRFVLDQSQSQSQSQQPNVDILLSIRCRQVNTSMSHTGEEVWDASKLFVAWLLQSSTNQHIIQNKRVLELGSGCGFLGMTVSALGAKHVLCTDFLPQVLHNLAFNLQHHHHQQQQKQQQKQQQQTNKNYNNNNISMACLDWTAFTLPDLSEMEWLQDNNIHIHTSHNDDTHHHAAWKNILSSSEQKYLSYSGDVHDYPADVIIGSALIYSPQGIPCADTIHHYFTKRQTKHAYILQLTDRPGFSRFILRIERLGHTCQFHDISKQTFHDASRFMGNKIIPTPRQKFKLLHIIPNSSSLSSS